MRLDACISIAKNIKPIADSGENWDSDPMLLGVNNGIVDLKTGGLRPGRLDDRITMTAGVDFDPQAKCPRWEQFLTEVFGNTELIDWLWRALGYSISGDTTEQVVFIGHGMGGNGKGVFCGALRAALGDYAYSSPFSTFELYQRASIPNDLAALEFKRFVTSSETNDNTRLNEARIKAISGCDPITARYLHQEYFTFYPHLKLWLFVNHKPKVVDDSFGFWRRVRLIPFTRQFTGEADDRRLGEKLKAEAPGILAWLVKGCLEWQKRGLDPIPECVKVATQEYREESDILAGFISERCIEHPKVTAKAAELYSAYKKWAESEGMRDREVLTSTAFGRRMGERYQKDRKGGIVYYFGIGLSGQLQDSFEANDTGNDVFPICNDSRVKHRKTILNYPAEAKKGGNYPASGDNHLEEALGMPVEKATEVWRREGAPVIHLGPRENCLDLAELLEQSDITPDHLSAIREWLSKHQGAIY
jgi:putative DNA primase/helicase